LTAGRFRRYEFCGRDVWFQPHDNAIWTVGRGGVRSCCRTAGAGAGKTRTLIYRVAFLLEQGIPADRILLLTFTNKAAREMMRRVADLLGGAISALWGGTFHSNATASCAGTPSGSATLAIS